MKEGKKGETGCIAELFRDELKAAGLAYTRCLQCNMYDFFLWCRGSKV